jgi:SAM-dependent methyltransferase
VKSPVKQLLKTIRSVGTFWIAEQTLDHLESIRTYELGLVLSMLPRGGRILEIGAGTGWQAKTLETCGFEVCAIDLPTSNYSGNRVWPITEYDGKHIPYEDRSFDIVFSSNVLEHIPHVYEFQAEILRVLKPDGYAVHVLPSSSWRLWTNVTHQLKHWTIPEVHGEHAKNALTEIYYFNHRWWDRLFRKTGWNVVTRSSNRLFYTGYSIMDSRLSIHTRIKMSRVIGSSCNIFVLRKEKARTGQDQ